MLKLKRFCVFSKIIAVIHTNLKNLRNFRINFVLKNKKMEQEGTKPESVDVPPKQEHIPSDSQLVVTQETQETPSKVESSAKTEQKPDEIVLKDEKIQEKIEPSKKAPETVFVEVHETDELKKIAEAKKIQFEKDNTDFSPSFQNLLDSIQKGKVQNTFSTDIPTLLGNNGIPFVIYMK
jgi:hypothetical protein